MSMASESSKPKILSFADFAAQPDWSQDLSVTSSKVEESVLLPPTKPAVAPSVEEEPKVSSQASKTVSQPAVSSVQPAHVKHFPPPAAPEPASKVASSAQNSSKINTWKQKTSPILAATSSYSAPAAPVATASLLPSSTFLTPGSISKAPEATSYIPPPQPPPSAAAAASSNYPPFAYAWPPPPPPPDPSADQISHNATTSGNEHAFNNPHGRYAPPPGYPSYPGYPPYSPFPPPSNGMPPYPYHPMPYGMPFPPHNPHPYFPSTDPYASMMLTSLSGQLPLLYSMYGAGRQGQDGASVRAASYPAAPTQDPTVQELVRQLQQAQEEAKWAKEQLADLLVKKKSDAPAKTQSQQPKPAPLPQQAKKQLQASSDNEFEDDSSNEYSEDFELSRHNTSMSSSAARLTLQVHPQQSAPSPALSPPIRPACSSADPAFKGQPESKSSEPQFTASSVPIVQQVIQPVYTSHLDPLAESIAKSFLASQASFKFYCMKAVVIFVN
ncbi:hypothetical protein EON65_33550 [archaeon]|nr:MAG: hypothetical protein EON65_33550 [archaeon]